MISVGIDVSKEKSTVCIARPYGEIVVPPFDIPHTEEALQDLADHVVAFGEDAKIVMESTGVYHLPVFLVLREAGLFVCAENPFLLKKYAASSLRKAKTDKIDAIRLANYGIDNWFRLVEYRMPDKTYEELKFLGRQYHYYAGLRVMCMLTLTNLLDRVMPGIKRLIRSNIATRPTKYKIGDFAEKYWHFDNIIKMSEDEFIADYMQWIRDNGYHNKQNKAREIYKHALQSVTSMSSEFPSTKIMVQEAVRVLRAINTTVEMLQLEMRTLAATLPEYETVRAMSGVGDILAPRIIGEIGDIRRFHSGKALVAFAGIDAPPYQSGEFTGTKRHISKRGSSILRKTGYEIIQCIKTIKPTVDAAVYEFIVKKEQEGKPKKVANIAGLNKFLRIYYARVLEIYAA